MLAAGLVDEVRHLLEIGYPPDLTAFSAIGYREIISHLKGEISISEAVELMRRQSRVFVRRQANWFKLDDPEIHWFQADSLFMAEIITTIQNWLEDSI